MRNWYSAFKAATGWGALIASLLIGTIMAGQMQETRDIMPFIQDATSCRRCHTQTVADELLRFPARACNNHCLTCHKNMTRHHTVGTPVDTELAPDLRITSKHELACITCHNLEQERFDRQPWRAESLFGSLFRKQTQYKTYYLAMRNNKGQLCRNCH